MATVALPSLRDLHAGYSVPEIVEISGRADFNVRYDITTGRLPAHKVAGRWKVLQADLDGYLEALAVPSPGGAA